MFLHLLSGYYYYDYVVIGVLRPSWFTKILFWIVLLLFKKVKQLKIIIIICLSYFILAVLMLKCLWKHSCKSSTFHIAILNGTFIFQRDQRRVASGSFVNRTTYGWSDFTLSINTKGRNCRTLIKPAIAGSSLWYRRLFYEANLCPRLLILFRFNNF